MPDFISPELIDLSIIAGPGLVIAIILLAAASGPLRGSWGAAIGALFVLLVAVAALCVATMWGLAEFYVPGAVEQCEGLEDAARTRGEAVLMECEDEGLIVVFPVFFAAAALIFIIIGALMMRMAPRRA